MSHYHAHSTGLLKPLAPWLENDSVNEILINRPQEIFIEERGQMQAITVETLTTDLLKTLFQLLANENTQTLSAEKPLLSASLQDGSRVQLVIPPTARHYTLSIRRKVARHLTLKDYETQDYYQSVAPCNRQDLALERYDQLPKSEQQLVDSYQQQCWGTFIPLAITLKKNIIISGGTSSGKTTFLNACLRHIPETERIITLEDTREIEIPHPNQVQLLAAKDGQGLAKLTMQDLIQCCLRLRPDRIIMGEIRGREIMDFISACSTGHEGSVTSIHANNPLGAFMRMIQMYKLNNVPSMSDKDIQRELESVVDIIIQLAKTAKGRKAVAIYYKYGHLAP